MMYAYMFVFRLKRLLHQKGKRRCFSWHNMDNIPVTTTCVHAHTCTGSWPYLFILSFWLTTKILKLIFSAYEKKKIRKSFVQWAGTILVLQRVNSAQMLQSQADDFCVHCAYGHSRCHLTVAFSMWIFSKTTNDVSDIRKEVNFLQFSGYTQCMHCAYTKQLVILSMNDLRPVTLTSAVMKVCECVVLCKLENLLKNYTDPLQFAYRKTGVLMMMLYTI